MRKLKIHIFRGGKDKQEWFFHVRSGNGERLLVSEGYVNQQDCLDTVELLQAHLGQADIILETKS
jgi:uncharacterized protein YegP (UPF0339 family)